MSKFKRERRKFLSCVFLYQVQAWKEEAERARKLHRESEGKVAAAEVSAQQRSYDAYAYATHYVVLCGMVLLSLMLHVTCC